MSINNPEGGSCYAEIIAGGDGTRLFPLTDDVPKYLLTVDGGDECLLEQTVNRARALNPAEITIITSSVHEERVTEKLPNLSNLLLVESSQRGTAGCVLAALARLRWSNADPELPVVFMHADHYIPDTGHFAHTVRTMINLSAQRQQIMLLGIRPDEPSTAFGYIERGDGLEGDADAFSVKSFKEKPDIHTAREWLRTGGAYLWNMGFFVAPTVVFERAIEAYAPTMWSDYQALLAAGEGGFAEAYQGLQKEAIDTALIERVPNLGVVASSFEWHDVGSFPDILKIQKGRDNLGNFAVGDNIILEGAEGTYVNNTTDMRVAVVGAENLSVIVRDGIVVVVAHDKAQDVKKVRERILAEEQQAQA